MGYAVVDSLLVRYIELKLLDGYIGGNLFELADSGTDGIAVEQSKGPYALARQGVCSVLSDALLC